MAKQSASDATDSALGYYFQAIYALIVLLDATDDTATVSVETQDDVEEGGPNPRLRQLKHSLGTPPALTEKNDGLWKTIGIWIPKIGNASLSFAFVTCAKLADDSPLRQLRVAGERKEALQALEIEAGRVVKAVADTKNKARRHGSAAVYAERRAACEAFLNLKPAERAELLRRISILDGNFNVTMIEAEVTRRLGIYQQHLRGAMSERLIEWWDRRVAKSLCRQADRQIHREELLAQIHDLVLQLADDNLPDDFSFASPDDPAEGLGTIMQQQIVAVDGGSSRLKRAALARWRAREQRDRWIKWRIGIAEELKRYDNALLESWNDRHGPMCDDCKGKGNGHKSVNGKALLDWSHEAAFKDIPPPRPKWVQAFLTQGTYQQLAEELQVGWHPDFRDMIKPRPRKPISAKPKRARKPLKK